MVDDSLYILEKMKDLNLSVSTQAYNSILYIVYNFRKTDKMWDVYKDIKSKNEHTYSTVVDGLCRQQKLEDAVSFLRDSEWKDVSGPSVVSFNSIMSAYCKSGFVYTAKYFLCTVLKCGLVPTVYSHNILINGLCLAGSIGEALELAGDMNIKHGVEPDTVTYNILAKGFHLLGNIDKGLRLLKDMLSSGFDLKLNSVVIPCNLCRLGELDMAIWLYDEICSKRILPNSRTRGAMLLGLCRKGMLLEPRALLNSLISTGCTVDITMYNIVIDGYAKSGYVEEALGLFRGVMESGGAPNVATFNSLIYGYCKTQNIAEARKGVLNHDPEQAPQPNSREQSM
ncbi:hypothetical protein Bca4012_009427 [Brassica carinata]